MQERFLLTERIYSLKLARNVPRARVLELARLDVASAPLFILGGGQAGRRKEGWARVGGGREVLVLTSNSLSDRSESSNNVEVTLTKRTLPNG